MILSTSKRLTMLGFIMMLAASTQVELHAQVISGESTYEDNFAHTPPSTANKSSNRDAVTKTNPESPSRRDSYERDRD